MKRVGIIISLDYELFGDGSGIVEREQIKPVYDFMTLVEEYGAKLTVFFEYAQYVAYEKYARENEEFAVANQKIREQLIALIKNGHDVQLHYHAQWSNAVYHNETKKFDLNLEYVDITSLNEDEILQVLSDGKEFLENLLKPYDESYECIAFRAGSWAVKNEKKLCKALKKCGFKIDSSVVPNAKFESEQVNFEYKNSPKQFGYWYIDDSLSKQVLKSDFIEIPIYTKKSRFAFLRYFNKKFLSVKKHLSLIYKTRISEQNFSIYKKIKKIFTRNYYMADMNTMNNKTLISMVEEVVNSKNHKQSDIKPLMFISHSKTHYGMEEIKEFFRYVNAHLKDDVVYWNVREAYKYIMENQKDIWRVDYLKSIGETYNNILPIVGREEYLKTKSNEYGWIVSSSYVIAFFIDKKMGFSRLVFTMAPFRYAESEEEESVFLNKTIDYIKRNKLCDFIYKAQSNVVFKSTPYGAESVPWGTYEVDLKKSEEELFSSFDSKCRNVIRNAIKNGVVVEKSRNVEDIYENIKSTLIRQKSVHYPSLDYLNKLNNLKNGSIFFVAKKDDVIQGSLVLLYDNYKGYAMYAGSIERPQTGSLDLLHFEAMKFLQLQGIHKYDFVGTRLHIKKGSKQEGIDRFKKKFRPQLIKGYSFKVIVKPFKYLLYSLLSQIYFKVRGIVYVDPIRQIQEEEKENSILLMGPRFNINNPHMIGGPIVLFEELINQLEQNNISYSIVDTNKNNYRYRKFSYLYIIVEFFLKARVVQYVSLHSSRDYTIFTPIIIFYAKIFHKDTSLRKFGGEAKYVYKKSSQVQKKYREFIFKNIDKLFFETKYLVEFFTNFNKNTYWFPNVRNRIITPSLPRKYSKRFVFISHVIITKGIGEILEASKNLDNSYTIDIYGPLLEGHYIEKDFEGYPNLTYKGALPSNKVLETLNSYDVVLLPSYKEGYPGIVIEAYSLGIPVITTNLDSICEIVDNYETGILVKPKNVSQLVEAMKYFNTDYYVKMSHNAYEKFNEFDSSVITKGFIDNVINK